MIIFEEEEEENYEVNKSANKRTNVNPSTVFGFKSA